MKDNNFNSFVMYHDFYDSLEELTNEEAGLLFKAIYNYQIGNDYLTEDKLVNIMLKTLIKTFERDKDKWLIIKEKRSEAAKTRWSNEKQVKPKTKVIKEPKPKTPKKQKEPKKKYGEYQQVLLNDKEYQKVITTYEKEHIIQEAISILDEYIKRKGKDPYKDHCVVLTGKNGWIYKDLDNKYNGKQNISKQAEQNIINDFGGDLTW